MKFFERMRRGRSESPPASREQEEQERESVPEEFPLLAERRRAYIDAYNTYRQMYGKPPKEKLLEGARQFVNAGDNALFNPFLTSEETLQEQKDAKERRSKFHEKLYHEAGVKDSDQRTDLYSIELAKADYEAKKSRLVEELCRKKYNELVAGEPLRLSEVDEKLQTYIAGELFQKFVIQEYNALAREKLESWPPKEKGIVKKGLDWWMGQNKYVRMGVTTVVMGGLGYAGLIPIGSAGLAWFAGKRFLRGVASMGAGHAVGKLYDKVISESGIENKKEEAIERLRDNFSVDNLKGIENAYREELEKAASKKRLRLVGKAALMLGTGIGTTTGFNLLEHAYSGGGAAVTHHEPPPKPAPSPEAPAPEPQPHETPSPEGTSPTEQPSAEPPLSEEQKIYDNLVNDQGFAKSQGWDEKTPLEEWAKGKAHELTHPDEAPPAPAAPPEPAPEKIPLAEKPHSVTGIMTIDIGNRGPQGAIIDSLKRDPELAKQYGWDGQSDISKWAPRRAHELWGEYSKEALTKPEIIEELKKLGYDPTPKGYTEMMAHIKKGSVMFHPNTHTIILGDDATYGKSPVYHEPAHGTLSNEPSPQSFRSYPAEQSSIEGETPSFDEPISYPAEGGESGGAVEYGSGTSEPSLHHEALEFIAPSTAREMAAVEVFGFSEEEYNMIKHTSVEYFLRHFVGSPEKAWEIYEKLPVDEKDVFVKDIKLAEYLRGFELDEHINNKSIQDFLQTAQGKEFLLEGTVGKEATILSILRFTQDQYGSFKEFFVKDFLETIPSREKAWELYGSKTAVPEFLRKQIELAEYIKRLKPNERLQSLTVWEFLRSDTH